MIDTITFRQSANVFINAGIVGFYYWSRKYLEKNKDHFPKISVYELKENELSISGPNLFDFLEEVYYDMGKEYFDTYSEKQWQEKGNIYYDQSNDSFERFPKMNTRGLTELLTNNAQGTTRNPDSAVKLAKLKKEDPQLVERLEDAYQQAGLKLDKKVYFEPYTKITRLEKPESKYFESGKYICEFTGESVKVALNSKSISPFLAGLQSFNSFRGSSDFKISWKAMYLFRFAPILCFYTYQNSFDDLLCFIVNSNSLNSMYNYFKGYKTLYKLKDELIQKGYRENFKLVSLSIPTKNPEKPLKLRGFSWKSEYTFALLYTIYKEFRKDMQSNEARKPGMLISGLPIVTQNKSISLVSFRADGFGNTKRPVSFEEFNQVFPFFQLLEFLNQEGLDIVKILKSLEDFTDQNKVNDGGKKNALITRKRAIIIDHILHRNSILSEIAELYYRTYNLLITGENPGYKDYKSLFSFFKGYESEFTINPQKMKPELQERAINLGKSIGYSMIHYDADIKEADNAKAARKYIIGLHKARTYEQFTEALIRIQQRFATQIGKDLLEGLNEQNFIMIRQFVVIGALNQVNFILNKAHKSKEDEAK